MSFPALALLIAIGWVIYKLVAIVYNAFISDMEDAKRLNSKGGSYYDPDFVPIKIEKDND